MVVVGSAVVVGIGRGVGIADCAVVLGAAVVTMVSGGAMGCVMSLVAQAVAVSAAMARTDTLKRCLIKIAPTVLMPLDNNTHQAGSQVRTD